MIVMITLTVMQTALIWVIAGQILQAMGRKYLAVQIVVPATIMILLQKMTAVASMRRKIMIVMETVL